MENRGYTFELPYRVSKGRPDQDNKGELCTTYDVIFHPEVISMSMLYKGDFLKFVWDTAVDGVNKVLAQDNEKLSQDYKMMKNLRCKGGEPASITIKVKSENPIINSMDPSKHETQLQKELTNQSKEAAEKRKEEDSKQKEESEDEGDEEEELKRIEGITEPRHKIVYSYPVDVSDCWEPPADVLKDRKFPISLRVTINTPLIESTKGAELDINEDTLMFKVPDIYDLMLTFKYKVDPDKGNAKFEKDKRRLLIDLPVIGVTEATHKTMREEKEQFEKNMKRISGNLVEDMDNYTEQVSKGFETNIDLEKEVDLNKLKEEALKDKEETDKSQDFLKVYDETKNNIKGEQEEEPKTLDEIKYKEDPKEVQSNILGINPLNNDVELVKEIPAETEVEKKEIQKIKEDLGIPERPKEKEFEWVEAMFQQRGELLFYMFNIKGYKEEYTKYFVSSTHLYLEYDDGQKVTKSYIEFPKEIDPYETKVQFIVGYINFTMK